MRLETTYKIEYGKNHKIAWLAVGKNPYKYNVKLHSVEEIPVVVADEGKTLFYQGREIGSFSILGDMDMDKISEEDIVDEDEVQEDQ